MGITFNCGTMFGTFNTQAAFMRGAATIRPPAPMPAGVRPTGGAHSRAPGYLAQSALEPVRVGTLGSAHSSPPGHLARSTPRLAYGVAGLFASVPPVGSDVGESAEGTEAGAATDADTATFPVGCVRVDPSDVGSYGPSNADIIVVGVGMGLAGSMTVYLGIFFLVNHIRRKREREEIRRIERERKVEELTGLHAKTGLEGVKRIGVKCEHCGTATRLDDDGPHKCKGCGAPLDEESAA